MLTERLNSRRDDAIGFKRNQKSCPGMTEAECNLIQSLEFNFVKIRAATFYCEDAVLKVFWGL